MSYSVIQKCGMCLKLGKCVDLQVLAGAVSAIHMIGFDRGHLGSGTITLDCQNLEEAKEKEK